MTYELIEGFPRFNTVDAASVAALADEAWITVSTLRPGIISAFLSAEGRLSRQFVLVIHLQHGNVDKIRVFNYKGTLTLHQHLYKGGTIVSHVLDEMPVDYMLLIGFKSYGGIDPYDAIVTALQSPRVTKLNLYKPEFVRDAPLPVSTVLHTLTVDNASTKNGGARLVANMINAAPNLRLLKIKNTINIKTFDWDFYIWPRIRNKRGLEHFLLKSAEAEKGPLAYAMQMVHGGVVRVSDYDPMRMSLSRTVEAGLAAWSAARNPTILDLQACDVDSDAAHDFAKRIERLLRAGCQFNLGLPKCQFNLGMPRIIDTRNPRGRVDFVRMYLRLVMSPRKTGWLETHIGHAAYIEQMFAMVTEEAQPVPMIFWRDCEAIRQKQGSSGICYIEAGPLMRIGRTLSVYNDDDGAHMIRYVQGYARRPKRGGANGHGVFYDMPMRDVERAVDADGLTRVDIYGVDLANTFPVDGAFARIVSLRLMDCNITL